MAAREGPLVEDAEEGVEDGGRTEEDLVEEGDLGLGQHARGLRLDDAFLELAQIDRSENLARLGEPAQQIFEIPGSEGARDPAYRLALRGSGGPDHEEVLARDRGERDQLHQ